MSKQWRKVTYPPNLNVPGPVWYRTAHGRDRIAMLRVYETPRKQSVLREQGWLWTWVVRSGDQKPHYDHAKTEGEAKGAASRYARKLVRAEEVTP